MTALTMPDHLSALRSDLSAAEAEWDRTDAQGDTSAIVRTRILIDPRIAHLRAQLRRALAAADRDRTQQGVN